MQLHAAIATLSTGPTAIGDGPGRTNEKLIRRSCRADGWLLQPAKPPTAVDAMYDGRTAPAGGFAAAGFAQVWTTFTNVTHAGDTVIQDVSGEAGGEGLVTWLVISIDVEEPFVLDGGWDLYPAVGEEQRVVWWNWHIASSHCINGSRAVAGGCVATAMPALHDTRPRDRATDSHSWSLNIGSPLLPSGWVLLGERDKWVSTSTTRFKRVTDSSESLAVEITGVASEVVTIVALQPVTGTGDTAEWLVREQTVVCSGGSQTVTFRTPSAPSAPSASFVHYQSVRTLGPNCCTQLPVAWLNQTNYKIDCPKPSEQWAAGSCASASSTASSTKPAGTDFSVKHGGCIDKPDAECCTNWCTF